MAIFYKPSDAWVGDVIPFWDGDYKLYFLADKRAGAGYAEHTDWDLIETSDMVHFAERGTAIAHGSETDLDRNAYTGSVLRDASGLRHIFYTGHNPAITSGGVPVQTVLHATSADGVRFQKDAAFKLPSDGSIYEVNDWRDPFVFWSEEESRYLMLVTTRIRGKGFREGGCVATLTSPDLVHWSYERPFLETNQYVTLECPDYFRMGAWHYLAYSTFSDRFVTHYRKSRSLRGPWVSAEVDTFDGRGCYAVKTAGHGAERFGFGWVPSKKGSTDFGEWEWAGELIVHHIWQDGAGDLRVKLPAAVEAAFSRRLERAAEVEGFGHNTQGDALKLACADGQAKAVLGALPSSAFVEARFRAWNKTRSFGIGFRCNSAFDQGYFIRFEPAFNRICFDMWPRRPQGEFQFQIAGDRAQMVELERPLRFDGLEEIRLKLVVENDIFMCNVNDSVTMTGRCYNHRAGRLAFFAHEGGVTVDAISVHTTP